MRTNKKMIILPQTETLRKTRAWVVYRKGIFTFIESERQREFIFLSNFYFAAIHYFKMYVEFPEDPVEALELAIAYCKWALGLNSVKKERKGQLLSYDKLLHVVCSVDHSVM